MDGRREEERRSEARRRRWADVVVIVAALYAFLAAVWSPPETLSGGGAEAVGNTGWLFGAYALGGALGLLGLFVAGRSPMAGKAAVGAGGLVMLSGFLAMRELTLLSALSIGGTGLLLLLAAPFVGPMPSPEEEGKPRSGLS